MLRFSFRTKCTVKIVGRTSQHFCQAFFIIPHTSHFVANHQAHPPLCPASVVRASLRLLTHSPFHLTHPHCHIINLMLNNPPACAHGKIKGVNMPCGGSASSLLFLSVLLGAGMAVVLRG